MAQRDPTTDQYFNQINITLEVDADIDDDEFDLYNNLDTLARLTGAPDGSTILVSRRTGGEDGFHLKVTHAGVFQYPSEFMLFNDGDTLSLMLWVDSIYVQEALQGMGIGTRSVMISLNEAKTIGVQKVALCAAGSAVNQTMFWGFHVWPSMGFDAELPLAIKADLPEELVHAEYLSDLMLSDVGERWWYHHGVSIDVEFDLSDQSVSWDLLKRYADAKGIRL